MEQTHKIQQCIFETSFDSEHNAFEFQQKLSDFVNNKLMDTIDSSLNKYDIDGKNVQIDQISLDIGKLSYHNFEYDMEIRVKNGLEKALSENIKQGQNYTEEKGIQIIPHIKSEINYLEIFLNTGSVPWQYKNSETQLTEIFYQTIKTEPTTIAQILVHSQNLNLTVKRIIKQFGFSKVEVLVQYLENKLQIKILQFVSSLNIMHRKLGFSNKSNKIFTDINHEVILSLLIKHSTKNTSEKEFINIYLRQLSKHLDIEFASFVRIIHSNLTSFLPNKPVSKSIENNIEAINSEIGISDNKLLKDKTVLPKKYLLSQFKAKSLFPFKKAEFNKAWESIVKKNIEVIYNEIGISDSKLLKDKTVLPKKYLLSQFKANSLFPFNKTWKNIDKKNPQYLKINTEKISVITDDSNKTHAIIDIADANVLDTANTNYIEELFNSILKGLISKQQFNKNFKLLLNKNQQVVSSLRKYAAKSNFISRLAVYLSNELFDRLLKASSQNIYSVYTNQFLLLQNYFLINEQAKSQLNQEKFKSFALMLLLNNKTEALSKNEILKTYMQSLANELEIDLIPLTTQVQNSIQIKLSELAKDNKDVKALHELNNSLYQLKNIKNIKTKNTLNSDTYALTNNNEENEEIRDSIYIQNAGLILIHPFISSLFQKLDLLNGLKFKSIDEQERAVLILQYIVDGQKILPEHILPLNKILCGLPLGYPVANKLTLNEEEKELIDSLLLAIIQQWRVLGNSSIKGLRESFLQREGKLISEEKNWKLLVEQKSFDMLLDQLPWSYTHVKLAWMKKAIVTSWRA